MSNAHEKAKSMIIDSLTTGQSHDCGVWDSELFEALKEHDDCPQYIDGYWSFSGLSTWEWEVRLIKN